VQRVWVNLLQKDFIGLVWFNKKPSTFKISKLSLLSWLRKSLIKLSLILLSKNPQIPLNQFRTLKTLEKMNKESDITDHIMPCPLWLSPIFLSLLKVTKVPSSFWLDYFFITLKEKHCAQIFRTLLGSFTRSISESDFTFC